MKDRYQEMIDSHWTTLWEAMKPFYDDYVGTRNHAWSGGPLINLSGHVAGVYPETPGYDTYHVIPQMGDLTQVAVSVPSVKGDIKVTIRKDLAEKVVTLSLVSPDKTVARVAIPKFDGVAMAVTINGGYEAEGVAFESEDEKYIYFTVQPGSYEFVGK